MFGRLISVVVFTCAVSLPLAVFSQEIYTIGYTTNEWQSHGSLGRQVILEENGRLHFAWNRGFGGQVNMVYYNSYHPDSGWFGGEEGIPVWPHTKAAYPDMAMLSPGGLMSVRIAYHVLWQGVWYAAVARWNGSQFENTLLPDYTFPRIAIDKSDRLHLAGVKPPIEPAVPWDLYYNRSEDGGQSFIGWQYADSIHDGALNLDASPASDKVGISYARPIELDPLAPGFDDNYLVESQDGINWDFVNERVNLTEFVEEDSLSAFVSTTIFYDDDNIAHTAFSTMLYFGPQGKKEGSRGLIWHHSALTDSFTVVADGLFGGRGGTYRLNVDQPSLALNPRNGYLYCAYVLFDSTDISHGRYSNGEIYISVSTDGGTNWAVGTNVTNTPSPECWPGDCRNEVMPCLAEVVNDTLHLFYILDLDAGASCFDEGVSWLSPVHYMQIPAEMIDTEPLIDQSKYRLHNHWTYAEAQSESRPSWFSCLSAYPNPFNSSATIEFYLAQPGRCNLKVFNVLGKEVMELSDGVYNSGCHRVRWEGTDRNQRQLSSGIYFIRLNTAFSSHTIKVHMLK